MWILLFLMHCWSQPIQYAIPFHDAKTCQDSRMVIALTGIAFDMPFGMDLVCADENTIVPLQTCSNFMFSYSSP